MTERDPIMLTVPESIEEYRRGRFVIMTDDEDRENEGDLVMAAQFVTPDAINFMAKYGRGLICCAITEDRVEQLKLPMMSVDNTSQFGTPFTVSVEAASGVTTGISAGDRAPSPCALGSRRDGERRDGGVRAVEHWRTVLANVMVSDVRAQVSLLVFEDWKDGEFRPLPRREDELATMLDQLVDLTEAVRTLRLGSGV